LGDRDYLQRNGITLVKFQSTVEQVSEATYSILHYKSGR